jgi:hypothetical protein
VSNHRSGPCRQKLYFSTSDDLIRRLERHAKLQLRVNGLSMVLICRKA